ncbi:MAG: rubrerythrin family protein [Planctomycetia bacterium]|nr:rubrerythrin family protein [Planctomycetia bacterium]
MTNCGGCCCKNKPEDNTLKNLLAAYNGESNASAKYAVYSEKAKADGYLAIAALFAAASKAETLHAARHARVIKSLGGEAVADIGTYEGKAIDEMLRDAIAGETEEFTHMYPGFIAEAEQVGATAAVASFKGALEAEVVHARLYQEALDNLDAWKAPRKFYVCSVCGWTEEDAAPEKCPICGVSADKFLEF